MPTQPSSDLPAVSINVAISADGKIAPANRRYTPFGSDQDHEQLLRLRASVDAVMAGARTVDQQSINLGPGPARYRQLRRRNGLAEYNLRVVVSGRASLDPESELLRHRFSPVVLLTTAQAGTSRLERLRQAGAIIEICGRDQLNLRVALRRLRNKYGVRQLLCEGGGELNGALLCAGLVGTVHVTICPTIFGGLAAPTLADGPGVDRLRDALKLRPKQVRQVGAELFLTYQVAAKMRQGRRRENPERLPTDLSNA